MFEILLGVSICITLHLGQCTMVRFKFVCNADFAVSMQLCIFAYELICFNQVAISCNGRPCLKDIYPVCVFCIAPVPADAQFGCAVVLYVNDAIQPTLPYYNYLNDTLALHNSTIVSIVCGLTPDKLNYQPLS